MPNCQYCEKESATLRGNRIHEARCKSKPAPTQEETAEMAKDTMKKPPPKVAPVSSFATFWRSEHGDEICDEVEKRVGKPLALMDQNEFCTSMVLLKRERGIDKPQAPTDTPKPDVDRNVADTLRRGR